MGGISADAEGATGAPPKPPPASPQSAVPVGPIRQPVWEIGHPPPAQKSPSIHTPDLLQNFADKALPFARAHGPELLQRRNGGAGVRANLSQGGNGAVAHHEVGVRQRLDKAGHGGFGAGPETRHEVD